MSDSNADDRTVDLEDFVNRAASLTRGQLLTEGSPTRTNTQRKYLRGLGQALAPVVYVGARGAIRSVVKAVAEQLDAHELIKVKIHESAALPTEVAALWLRGETSADIVQVLGHTVVLYKQRALKPTIKLPRD